MMHGTQTLRQIRISNITGKPLRTFFYRDAANVPHTSPAIPAGGPWGVAAPVADHAFFPVYLLEPVDDPTGFRSSNRPACLYDLSSNAVRNASLSKAILTAAPSATGRFHPADVLFNRVLPPPPLPFPFPHPDPAPWTGIPSPTPPPTVSYPPNSLATDAPRQTQALASPPRASDTHIPAPLSPAGPQKSARLPLAPSLTQARPGGRACRDDSPPLPLYSHSHAAHRSRHDRTTSPGYQPSRP